ncbi:hypothetical protein [Streptomyces sp. BE133]|uniref:hypothetical protein n=1 Tax=Streptomyces sp. BE133 TaxID=3002523 RepID=UPI002E794598|nr:hypothetical protein [Streptomyces sp. BE133]MEE1807726.1 hypothetical protein [Streptomyces sp. BE133]
MWAHPRWCTVDAAELNALTRKPPTHPWLGSSTITSGRSGVRVVANLQTPAGPLRVARPAALSPSLRVGETRTAGPAVKLHTRWLDGPDRFTDDICNPYAVLAPQLIARVGGG